ncbi:hypothetical protein Tco_1571856, partial [Tanacetum coccineum]
KDKGLTPEYILLLLQPHKTRIPIEDVAPVAHETPSEKDEQVLHDGLEKMIAQEVVATALDDATRQAFEEEKRNIASQKRAAQTTSITKFSTGRSTVSTATTPYVSAASTSTGANAGKSSFIYLGGKIPIDASTLPNADLPIDPNMPDLEDDSDAFSSDGIFNGAYNDENVRAVVNFNNIDDTINVSPIPTLRIHKNYPKDQILGDPKSAVQTRGKIQKASSAQQVLPNPSPRPSPTIPIPDSIPEGSGRNYEGQSSSDRSLSGNEDDLTLQSIYDLCVSLCKQVTTQAAQIKDLKSRVKQLKKKAKPVITHHKAWMKSVSMVYDLYMF